MKKLVFFLALIASVALTVTSCDPDEECTKDCGLNGTVTEFCDCNCDPGWEYDADGSCTVETIAKFRGEFRVVENDTLCSVDPTPYLVMVTDLNLDSLKFGNIYASGDAIATFSGNDLTIERQAFGALEEIEGSGVLQEDGNIIMQYRLYDNGAVDAFANCVDVLYEKQ